jgi:hypothetical protein
MLCFLSLGWESEWRAHEQWKIGIRESILLVENNNIVYEEPYVMHDNIFLLWLFNWEEGIVENESVYKIIVSIQIDYCFSNVDTQ